MNTDLVTPRFSDRINFPRYRKLMAFDPDLVTPRFSDRKTFPPRMSLNRGPTVPVLFTRPAFQDGWGKLEDGTQVTIDSR